MAESTLRAQPPLVFRALLGMSGGGGIRRSRIPLCRARQVGVSGWEWLRRKAETGFLSQSWRKPPAAGGSPRWLVPGAGWSLQGRKFPGSAACVTAGLAPRSRLGGRWRPQGRALGGAGCRWPSCARGGAGGGSVRGRGGGGEEGLRGWGVSCVPAGSPRRERGGGRLRGRGCSALALQAMSSGPARDPAVAGSR